MALKSILAKIYASYISKKVYAWAENPIEIQQKVFEDLIAQAKDTVFGKEHHFNAIKNYSDYKNSVPVRDYEDLKIYI